MDSAKGYLSNFRKGSMVNPLWENIFRKSSENDDVLHILGNNILFTDLGKRELRFVSDIIHVREYRAGEKVFNQGEIGVGMYLVVKGSVDIVVEETSGQREADKNIFITRLSRGDFFGELSLIEDPKNRHRHRSRGFEIDRIFQTRSDGDSGKKSRHRRQGGLPLGGGSRPAPGQNH